MYGTLVGKLKIAPSEARQMTLGEAYALIDAICDTKESREQKERMALGKITGIL